MAHHGTSHTRYNRMMRKKSQPDSGSYGDADQQPDSPTAISPEPVVYGLKDELILDRDHQKQDTDASLLEKRQQSDTLANDQTTVSATVINVVDHNSQAASSGTSATPPTTVSDESTVAATSGVSTEAESIIVSLSASISVADNPHPSPAYSSPTADTPAVTSTREASSTAPLASSSIPSKTSTPLFGVAGSAATAHPSMVSGKPSSAFSDYSPSQTQGSNSGSGSGSGSGTAVSSGSGSAWVFGSGSQSTNTATGTATTTTSSYTGSVTSATDTYISSGSSSTDSFYGTWSTGSSGGAGGSGATATGNAPLSTSSGSSSGGSGVLSNQAKGKIAGGVVGGVAAAMIVFVIVAWLLRRKKKGMQGLLPSGTGALPAPDTAATATTEGSFTRMGEMASRRSSNDPLFTASYFAPAFMKRWRQSHMTTRTEDSVSSEPSERGFQKIAGRKIPSVLHSGGDGYGGGFEPGSPTTSETFSAGSPAEETAGRMMVFRPSPARTASANASLHSEHMGPRPVSQVPQIHVSEAGPLSPTMPKRPDALGRSHPSFDGSRGSRFTESI
ncbi:hypothetical protein BO70DRAFT_357471 [Aspergillus heteromorphus CBS 117.55]|uniref:Uncharacterized protein n=1 Tax=Aspergillus heteromorphus CBS 117.55 TaxID=1448321 RepID=A0A317X1X9_9EURO|nr:uncharacterized protein BO70DRAFT_357471 [Aspergillus heteromorphus CBS 117.55]PWY92355.1 hypothetical protein BO70DRAFT_357471 [Aspergillus heteromorphus CBS 117.55]